MNRLDKKLVVAGLARDVAPYIEQVRRNIEIHIPHFAQWTLILVENDSKDDTKRLLKEWVAAANRDGVRRAVHVELDGLGTTHPDRTVRLAHARNQYLKIIANSGLKDFDYLAVLDLDGPNSLPGAMENFMRAVEFLQSHDDVAAVFPNQLPVYYDIWALREPTWCPEDFMNEIYRADADIGRGAAIKKFIYDRQIFIDPAREPIEVHSAFGGIGIYKISEILNSTYSGAEENGAEVCEHVPFHRSVQKNGKKFFILPDFLNYSSFEATSFGHDHDLMPVSAGGRTIKLLGRTDHPFAKLQAQYPLCGVRFAQLAALFSSRQAGTILDIGADIGHHLAQCRLNLCRSDYICVEGRESFFALLSTNALLHRNLFVNHQRINKFVDGDSASAVGLSQSLSSLDNGQVGLIRLNSASNARILLHNISYLREHRPVLWVESQACPADLPEWKEAIRALSATYTHILILSSSGAVIDSGTLATKQGALELLLGEELVEFALFSPQSEDLYVEFGSRLNMNIAASVSVP